MRAPCAAQLPQLLPSLAPLTVSDLHSDIPIADVWLDDEQLACVRAKLSRAQAGPLRVVSDIFSVLDKARADRRVGVQARWDARTLSRSTPVAHQPSCPGPRI
jgi:hypothetical protein